MSTEQSEDQLKRILEIPIESLNFANSTKWIFNIPIGHLFNLKNANSDGQILEYPLNCRSVSFPKFQMGTNKISYMGYGIDMSTRQNMTEKGITFSFLVSNNWLQYLMLLKWFELEDFTKYNANRADTQIVELGKIKPTISEKESYLNGSNPYYSTQGPMVPCNLYLLDNFNNRICTINFDNAWLASIDQVDLDYSTIDKTEILVRAELKFYKYNININDLELKNFF